MVQHCRRCCDDAPCCRNACRWSPLHPFPCLQALNKGIQQQRRQQQQQPWRQGNGHWTVTAAHWWKASGRRRTSWQWGGQSCQRYEVVLMRQQSHAACAAMQLYAAAPELSLCRRCYCRPPRSPCLSLRLRTPRAAGSQAHVGAYGPDHAALGCAMPAWSCCSAAAAAASAPARRPPLPRPPCGRSTLLPPACPLRPRRPGLWPALQPRGRCDCQRQP